MTSLKYFHKSVKIIILVIIICAKGDCTYLCRHNSNKHHTAVPILKYNFMPKTLITLKPNTKVELVKYSPISQKGSNMQKTFYVLKKQPNSNNTIDAETKKKALLLIIKALQRNNSKEPTTKEAKIGVTSAPKTNPQQSDNFNINHQVVHGHSYVYNINNYGTHYHNYDPISTTETSKPHTVDLIPADVKKANELHKKNKWVNDVKLS